MKKNFLIIILLFGITNDVFSKRYFFEDERSWGSRFLTHFFQPEKISDTLWFVGTTLLVTYIVTKVLNKIDQVYKPIKVNEKFSSVAGASEAKSELQYIVNFLKKPEEYSKLGARVPSGVLLIGSPGNGKTLLARAVAGEANCSFFYTTGSEFVDLYVGMGARKIRNLFNAARKHAPAIIFIDEIDAVGKKRNESMHIETQQTLNQLLTELDGFLKSDKPIIVIAATNRPEVLDDALIRPGRFDRKIYVNNPNIDDREAILKLYAKKIAFDESVDFKKLASGTQSFSAADLANLVNQAAIVASQNNKDFVTMNDFDEARDIILLGGAKSSLKISQEEKIATAYHEAGHALIRVLLSDLTDPLYKVTIIPRGNTLGVTHSIPDEERYSEYKDEMIALVKVFLGGRIAEEVVFGENVSGGAISDFEKATEVLRYMICNLGMSEELGVVQYYGQQKFSEKIMNEISCYMTKYYQETKDLIINYRKELDMIAHELLRKETLSGQEIYDLIGIQPLANRSKKNIKKYGIV